jgi:hypothetical protein
VCEREREIAVEMEGWRGEWTLAGFPSVSFGLVGSGQVSDQVRVKGSKFKREVEALDAVT